MLSAPCSGTCEAIKCRLISQKELHMCTKYLYILTHFLEKEEKYSKLSYKFRKRRQSAGNFPTHCRARRKCVGRFPTLSESVGRFPTLLKSVGRLLKSVGRFERFPILFSENGEKCRKCFCALYHIITFLPR